jgi:drug/metabolite transporter (DMT)-like permease
VKRPSGNLYSIYAMLLAVFMFALMDTAMKLLSARYPALQVAALRAICSLPLIALYVAWRGAFAGIFRVRWPMHLLRAGLGILMLALFAFGLQKLSLAEAYSIFFIAPALITALSVLLLRERVDLARWLAVLGSAACYAVSAITVRVLSRTDRSEHTVFWLMVLIAIGAGALAAPDWVPMSARDIPILCGLAVSGFIGQLAITEAFSRGEASSVAPFEYSALAWGVGLDWLLWRALPDSYTLLGAAIIIGSGLYLIRHEKEHVEAEHP